MTKVFRSRLLLVILIISVLSDPGNCYGKETGPGPSPVYGEDIKDGSYQVEVESSSSMFRVVKAKLNVENGSMEADITLSGTGYLKLFMGKGQEALEAGEDSYIPYVEYESGAYTYTIPIEALNAEFPCAAYSKRKETWYDRQLVIWSSALPEEAFTGEVQEKVEPAPVLAWDEEMDVTADTVAMSSPHEIAYTLTFHSDTLQKEKSGSGKLTAAIFFAAAAAAGAGWLIRYKGRRKADNV